MLYFDIETVFKYNTLIKYSYTHVQIYFNLQVQSILYFYTVHRLLFVLVLEAFHLNNSDKSLYRIMVLHLF